MIDALVARDNDFADEHHGLYSVGHLMNDTCCEEIHLNFHLLRPELFSWEKTTPEQAATYGAVSHFSAAELHGCTTLPMEMHLTTPTLRHIDGLHLHTSALAPSDLTVIEGLAVTSLERTTRDLGAAVMDGEHRARWMDFLVEDKGWSVGRVLEAVGPHAAAASIAYFEAAA
ncbi:hypothetical protein [Actinomyces urogenitalis]|uniref:hypothetical protein n=1 Tax=Actinomyces urogenitalis TaxID=103621 RepID=UPI00242C008A|nr:hypothetical protein [Actinomyces urogenitalis]MCI7456335.1 hypothetical protein [Actinomyces urogenitalis]